MSALVPQQVLPAGPQMRTTSGKRASKAEEQTLAGPNPAAWVKSVSYAALTNKVYCFALLVETRNAQLSYEGKGCSHDPGSPWSALPGPNPSHQHLTSAHSLRMFVEGPGSYSTSFQKKQFLLASVLSQKKITFFLIIKLIHYHCRKTQTGKITT